MSRPLHWAVLVADAVGARTIERLRHLQETAGAFTVTTDGKHVTVEGDAFLVSNSDRVPVAVAFGGLLVNWSAVAAVEIDWS